MQMVRACGGIEASWSEIYVYLSRYLKLLVVLRS
jgi:hypothetical protein